MRRCRVLAVAAFAVVLIASACVSDPGYDASVIGCADDGAVPHADCECVPSQSNDIIAAPSCAPLLCAVKADYAEFVFCSSVAIVDEGALACALEALRARTPGVVTWEVGGGYCGAGGYTLILDDGLAITRHISHYDLGHDRSDAVRGSLLPSSHFADCAAKADINARFDCLESTVVESPVMVCDQAYGCEVW